MAEAKDVFFTQSPDLLMATKWPAKYKIEAEGLFEMLKGCVSRQCIVDADTDFVKNLTKERDIFVNEELPY